MSNALRFGMLVLVTVLAMGSGLTGQTKDSPLYRAQGPDPRKIKTVIPKYPKNAQTGSMVLELILRPDGKVDSVKAIRSLRGATAAALAATRQWQYEPVIYRGKPVWAVIYVLISNPWNSEPILGGPGRRIVGWHSGAA